MKNVCDWDDFKKCVTNVGNIAKMNVSDFKQHESRLSQSKASKTRSPFLETVSAFELKKGSYDLNRKMSHTDKEIEIATFLQKKIVIKML